jgi:hypothetical protein
MPMKTYFGDILLRKKDELSDADRRQLEALDRQAQMGAEGAKRFEEMLIKQAERDMRRKQIKDLGKIK